MQPCYAGTSVECRADGDTVSETRAFEDTAEVVDNTAPPDLSEYEKRLDELRAMSAITDAEKRLAELRNAVPPSEKAGEFRYNDVHKADGTFGFKKNGNSSSGVDKSKKSGIIKATPQQRKEFTEKLKGTKTQSGVIINEVGSHAADRMVERNIPAEKVKDIITSNSASVYPGNKAGRTCSQKDMIRVVYSDDGAIISVVDLDD